MDIATKPWYSNKDVGGRAPSPPRAWIRCRTDLTDKGVAMRWVATARSGFLAATLGGGWHGCGLRWWGVLGLGSGGYLTGSVVPSTRWRELRTTTGGIPRDLPVPCRLLLPSPVAARGRDRVKPGQRQRRQGPFTPSCVDPMQDGSDGRGHKYLTYIPSFNFVMATRE